MEGIRQSELSADAEGRLAYAEGMEQRAGAGRRGGAGAGVRGRWGEEDGGGGQDEGGGEG